MVAVMLEPRSPASAALYDGIQAVRRTHDPDFSSWLPHIPLISPFMLTSPIPKEHGPRWSEEGQMPARYRLGHRMVRTPPLALEDQDSILESEHFFRRGPHEYVPPLRAYVKHVSATLRGVASSFPGGAFSLNLTTPDFFVTNPSYKFHLRPTPVPERRIWDLNKPWGRDKTLQRSTFSAAEKQWHKTGVYAPPPGLPFEDLQPESVSRPDVPDYRHVQGEEGTRRLLLLQHRVHQALLSLGATLPPSPRNVYKPHLTVGQTTKNNPNERMMMAKLADLLAPRHLSDLDQQGARHGAPSFPVVRMSLLVKHEHDPSQFWVFEEYPLARALQRSERLPRFASRAGKRAEATDPDSPRLPKSLLVPVFDTPPSPSLVSSSSQSIPSPQSPLVTADAPSTQGAPSQEPLTRSCGATSADLQTSPPLASPSSHSELPES